MQDARSVSNSPDTCVGQGGFCFSKDRRRVSFGPANSIQWSVAFRDLFVSRVFKLGEMDGLKDLLINGWLTTIAFKEFPNVPQQLIWTWLIFHLPLFQGTGNSVLNSPCVFSLTGSVPRAIGSDLPWGKVPTRDCSLLTVWLENVHHGSGSHASVSREVHCPVSLPDTCTGPQIPWGCQSGRNRTLLVKQ